MKTSMDKDRLAAFVDGELSPEHAAAVAMHLADHSADQAYVDDLFAANEMLAQAFATPLHEPVPEAIRAVIIGSVAGARVVELRPRRTILFGGLALAASAAVAALVLPGLLGAPDPAGIPIGPLAVADPVAAILETEASGVPVVLADRRKAMVLGSLSMPDGRFCREIEMIDAAGGRIDYAVGCSAGQGWTIEAATAETIGNATEAGFVPAGAVGEATALTRFLERGGTPKPLDAEAEAAAIRHGWAAR